MATALPSWTHTCIRKSAYDLLAVTCAWTMACKGPAIIRSIGRALITEPIRLLSNDISGSSLYLVG
ncbi:hypothetical protein D3C71_2071800 [compost metagenome]